MTMASSSSSNTGNNSNQGLQTSLSKTNNVVSNSLHRTIQKHVGNKEYDAKSDGLDFLQVKNGLMISYLIDLTMLLRSRLNNSTNNNDGDGSSSDSDSDQQCLERLLEMKTALEKIRPVEKRMRYQIDKLLALATLGAGTFAGHGREEEEEEEKEEEKIELGDNDADEDGQVKSGDDPLSFKPDLQGMMKMFQEDDNADDNDDDSNSESGEDNDDEEEVKDKAYSKPKIALERDDNDTTNNNSNNSGIYQPPRLQSVPFELDNEAALAKQQRALLKQRDRLSRSELTAVIRSQFTDAPEVEDASGGAMLGKQSDSSRKIAMRDKNIQEFEESQMIRLTMGRKEKKDRKRMMREEMSNLGAIASGLGHVGGGVDDAFGRDDSRGGGGRGMRDGDGDDDGGASFKMKGMRKRVVDVLDPQEQKARGFKKKKKGGASNTYQKSLYGGSGGDGGGGRGGSRGGSRGRGKSSNSRR